MRRKSNPLLIAGLLASLVGNDAAGAEWPSPGAESTASWRQLGRTLGVGWSDGYHACVPRPVRLGENLPPRGYVPSPVCECGASAVCGCDPWAPRQLGRQRGPATPMPRLPSAAPAPLPPETLPPETLPPSVLQERGVGSAERGPANRVSRSAAPAWKWIREPGATGATATR